MISKIDTETGKGEVQVPSNADSQNYIEDNIHKPPQAETINIADDDIVQVHKDGIELQSISSPPSTPTLECSTRGRLVFQCPLVSACCLLIFHSVWKVAPLLFDLCKAEMNIVTFISFIYNVFILVNRVQFFLSVIKCGDTDIQPCMKFICSRIGAAIDNHVKFEMESNSGYILMGAAAFIGIFIIVWNKPCLDLPLGKLLLELAGIPIQYLSTVFQLMYSAITGIIFANKVQEMMSNESKLSSCQTLKNPLEISKLCMAAARVYVTVHYWVHQGNDLLPVIWDWRSILHELLNYN